MTVSPRSGSDEGSASDRLAEPVQRWIWEQGWSALRDVQAKAIPAVLAGGDVVISARTAAGKTEAAFLPLLTRVLRDRPDMAAGGFELLYVSPLKALINDQVRRLEPLLEACEVPLHRWHGDVAASAKQRARERPSGLVLITPKSLEATLVRRGRDVRRLFASLHAVVIDELHAFIGSERGIQLQSILHRIEVATSRGRIDRIGLSATLGDMRLAAEALRPGAGGTVALVEGADDGAEIRLQIRGYARPRRVRRASAASEEPDAPPTAEEAFEPVVDDLFRLLRGQTNLVFAGSRRNVEIYADALRQRCEDEALPNEFFPHHGNLAKEQREEVEARLRDDPRPTTAVATTTLELGIDIGDVETVGQIGPGYSVASLRQRLGRSGRRPGRPAVLRIFVLEPKLEPGLSPVDRLRLDLVQSIAMIQCLHAGWCEPPASRGLHLSTLLHQTLAAIVQHEGLRPLVAWRLLCEAGPFRSVGRDLYVDLLRAMAHPERQLIEQTTDGDLMLGEIGERIAASHEFYAVFESKAEFRVIEDDTELGTIPLDRTIAPGQTLIFAGRRWRVLMVNEDARSIVVEAARTAQAPIFSGGYGGVHDRIVEEMRTVLRSAEVPNYLDRAAADLLVEARAAYREFDLERRSILDVGSGVVIFPWVGTRKLETFALALLDRNLHASATGHVIEVEKCDSTALARILDEIAVQPPSDPLGLTRRMPKRFVAKFDRFLSDDLLDQVALAERLAIESIPETARSITNRLG